MTIKEMLARSVEKRREAVALRFKLHGAWQTLSYQDLLERTHRIAEALAELGVKPGDRVGIFLENVPEWPEIYFGLTGLGAVCTHVDAKLQEQEVAHILRDSGTSVLVADAKEYPLLRDIEPNLPDLRAVLLIGGRDVLPVTSKKVQYLDYESALNDAEDKASADGRAYDRHAPQEDDLASLIYTSGTTGRPKGAMLTHRNLTANVEACTKVLDLHETDNFLLVLPLHHSFAFTTNLLLPVLAASEISFVESLKTVGENTREVCPTVLIGVPLLLEKMHKRIMAGLKEKKAAHLLYRLGLKKLIGKGIHKKLGGKLRFVITGGGPCPLDVIHGFMYLGIPILEGYGLTETAPVLTVNPPAGPRPGTIGKALPGVELTVMDTGPDGSGEIAAKGPNIMKGYYNAPEATAEVFRDGWFMTGDLGFIDGDGYVTITGRKKNLIVNREGKNIHPEEVEEAICRSPFILEALVLGYSPDGDRKREQVGAIVVPNQEAIDAHAAKEQKHFSDRDVQDLIRAEVKRASQAIAEYKRPRRIQIRYEEFGRTSTGKIKRYLYALETASMTQHGED
ncbi:MAG: AMP-binding protein [Kiritimatiellae bacterium]|nr:AMP-binding protein [Kiritimatiellia bacterium]